MIKKLHSIMVPGLIFLAACQTTPSVTNDDLLGAWRYDGAGFEIEFKEDGTYNVGAPDLSEFGEYKLEGRMLTIMTAEDALFCSGLTGIYEIELTDERKLHWTLAEDECGGRAEDADNSFWSRVSP